jgi:hypothetical protein
MTIFVRIIPGVSVGRNAVRRGGIRSAGTVLAGNFLAE